MAILRVVALPEGLPELADLARAEGFRMLDVILRDWADGSMRFTGQGEALFAAHDAAGGLCGIGGITRDPWADALRMRRFYVAPRMRGAGIGAELAQAALAVAFRSGAGPVRLRAPASAFAFWERMGFTPLLGDPQATHAMDVSPG
jgi:GNAT superfamily N-acetyltransferase